MVHPWSAPRHRAEDWDLPMIPSTCGGNAQLIFSCHHARPTRAVANPADAYCLLGSMAWCEWCKVNRRVTQVNLPMDWDRPKGNVALAPIDAAYAA